MGALIVPDKIDVKLRWMQPKDTNIASDIEDYNIGGYTTWDFKKFLKEEDTISLVAEYHSAVVGFILCENFDTKIRIVNFAVTPELKRRSIGTQLIKRIQNFFLKKPKTSIFTEVNERNLTAQLFLQKQGFTAIDIQRNFYGIDSAYILEWIAPQRRKEQKLVFE